MARAVRALAGWAPVVGALSLAACGGDTPAGTAGDVTTTVDSSGPAVTVHNAGRAPSIGAEPVFTVGDDATLEGGAGVEFGRIRAVLLGPEGELYVGDGHSRLISVFDSTGALVRTLGRRGAGPGEIEGLQDLGWVGDTLVAMDSENGRLTRLTRRGEYAGQWPFMRASGPGVRLHNAGVDELYSFAIRVDRSESGGQPGSVWARWGPEGALDTVPRALAGVAPAEGSHELCRAADGLSVFTNPVGEILVVRPAPGGTQAVARSSSYHVAFVGPAGDTVRGLSRDARPPTLDDAAWDSVAAAYDEWKAQWRGGDCEGGIARPSHGRLLLGLHFDAAGRLIVEYEDEAGPALDFYDAEGRWTGRAAFPDRDRSVDPAFRDGRVAVVRRDSLDIQRVEVLRWAPGIS